MGWTYTYNILYYTQYALYRICMCGRSSLSIRPSAVNKFENSTFNVIHLGDVYNTHRVYTKHTLHHPFNLCWITSISNIHTFRQQPHTHNHSYTYLLTNTDKPKVQMDANKGYIDQSSPHPFSSFLCYYTGGTYMMV